MSAWLTARFNSGRKRKSRKRCLSRTWLVEPKYLRTYILEPIADRTTKGRQGCEHSAYVSHRCTRVKLAWKNGGNSPNIP